MSQDSFEIVQMKHDLEGIDADDEVITPFVQLQRDVEKLRESKYIDSAAIVDKDIILEMTAGDVYGNHQVKFALRLSDASKYPSGGDARLSVAQGGDKVPDAVTVSKQLTEGMSSPDSKVDIFSITRRLAEHLCVRPRIDEPVASKMEEKCVDENHFLLENGTVPSDLSMGPLERRSSTVSQASVISEDDAGWESVGTPSAEISDEWTQVAPSPEEEAARSLASDIHEVTQCFGYEAASHPGRQFVRVYISLSMQQLRLSREQATAWNMDYGRKVVVSMDFPRDYTGSVDRPINIKSYQSADKLSDHVNCVEKDEVSYGLSWMVKDRIQGDFLKHWPPKLDERPSEVLSTDSSSKKNQMSLAACLSKRSSDTGDDEQKAPSPPLSSSQAAPKTPEVVPKQISSVGSNPSSTSSSSSTSIGSKSRGSFFKRRLKRGKNSPSALSTTSNESHHEDEIKSSYADPPQKSYRSALTGKKDSELREQPMTPPSKDDIVALVESLFCSNAEATAALLMCGNDRTRAAELIMESHGEVADYILKNKEKQFFLLTEAEKSSRAYKMADGVGQLLTKHAEVLMADPLVAYLALEDTNLDVSAAEVMILNTSELEELKRRALNRREGNSDDLENPSDSNRAPASGEGDHLIAPEHVTELGDWNYLFRMLRYLEQMILTCPSRCMMCDKELSFSGYKPAICDAKLCSYKFDELGFGVDLLAELKQNPEVTDLLICFLMASISGNRIDNHFPDSVRARTADGGVIDFNKSRERLIEVINLIPDVDTMATFDTNAQLKRFLAEQHKALGVLIYPLLQWLHTTNRAHIRKLAKHEEIEDVDCAAQFVMLTTPPKKDVEWRRQRDAAAATNNGKGSVHMFHGSPIGNWHSIIRNGLMVSGQQGLGASGPSIWMANQFQTSVGYCLKAAYQGGWSRSRFGPSIVCMGVLEVVHDPGRNVTENATVCVVSDTSMISTRYFLIFKDNIRQHKSIVAQQLKYPTLEL